MDDAVQFLKRTEVFKGLETAQLLTISRLFREVSLKKGEPVVYMGGESDSVFLIRAGRCKVFVPFDYAMGENILSYLGEGDLFGEMGVISGGKRTTNITCFTDVELLVMSGEDFWTAAHNSPAILKNIISILSDRLATQNLRARARKRGGLNLNRRQRDALDSFYGFLGTQNRTLLEKMMTTKVPERRFRWSPLQPFRNLLNAILKFFINLATKPYISGIDGLEKIPKDKPVVFLLSFRTFFDYLFLLRLHRQLDAGRSLCFAFRVDRMGKIVFFLLRGLFSILKVSYLSGKHDTPNKGAEDTVKFLNHLQRKGGTVDVAMHPFLERSMRYDRMMGYHHFIIWLETGKHRDLVPVSIRGTDTFWPFEPWNRKFFNISAFFNLNSVSIKIGETISLTDMGFEEKFDECEGDQERIKSLFDRTNQLIGNRLAALDGHQYTPMYLAAEQEFLRSFNEKWSNRLSLMLPAGLGLRRKYRKPSVKIRHFAWHAEMLNVLLEHLEGEKYFMPAWAKGMLIAGASYADLKWPFFSMDHSYNPYIKKGMKLVFRFPDLMTLIRKEVDRLFQDLDEEDFDIEKTLTRMGRIYHFLSDLAVPAHVHNIPHSFVDLPKIGKCDFEEYLGLDQSLLRLNLHEIGDISARQVESFEAFYECLDNMARYTFLNASFDYNQLRMIATDRMISTFEGKEDLIEKLKKRGVSVLPVEGFVGEERFYVRNLTTHECEKISEKTTYYSLKAIASCLLFLMGEVNERLEALKAQVTSPFGGK
jgi:CRP-like cAMP-binding protein